MKKLTDNTFNDVLNNSDALKLIKFHAAWCNPCQLQKLIVNDLVDELPYCEFYGVDVQEETGITAKFIVNSLPTMLLFKGNDLIDRRQGFMAKNQLKLWIEDADLAYKLKKREGSKEVEIDINNL